MEGFNPWKTMCVQNRKIGVPKVPEVVVFWSQIMKNKEKSKNQKLQVVTNNNIDVTSGRENLSPAVGINN